MRIGIFDPYLDDLGGGEKYMVSIAEHFSKDHQVEIFWENADDLKKISERFSLNISKIKLVKNIFSPNYSLFKRLKESIKYDVIIVLSDGSLPILLAKKVLIHFQQPFPSIKPNFKNFLKKVRLSSFFCNSKFTKSFIDKEFTVNSEVIYPAIEIKAKNTKKENIILHVGRFRVKDVTTSIAGVNKGIGDYKKQGVMIRAFRELVDEGLKNWKFVLAVSVNQNEQEIFSQFQKTVKGYPIEFLINKNNDELWDIYSKAKIYWHASGYGEDLDAHPEFAEHFGISTVEAMGAGAVPVVINAGGQKEIIEDGKNGFLWDSLNELKSKTLKLMDNEALSSKLSIEARASAKKFDKENFYQAIDNLITR